MAKERAKVLADASTNQRVSGLDRNRTTSYLRLRPASCPAGMVAGPPHTEMDEANEDNEIRARKALGSFISDLVPLIDSIVWKPANPELGRRQVHSKVKKQSLEHAIGLVFFYDLEETPRTRSDLAPD